MESIYIFIVAVLVILAVSDLTVGVANDAVNFLNSAFGSKVAPFRVVLLVASLGVVIGATFSSGMMEVARSGIFNPSAFTFEQVMIIFVVVMVTDIILLDMFNTLGLPTSTTVSIVFNLLGASVGVAVITIAGNQDGEGLATFINSSRALAIILGILISIVVAFSTGMIIQYITRVIFSFDYRKSFRFFGPIWGGFAITAITYFIVIKGAKGSSLMSEELVNWILGNSGKMILTSFIGFTVLLQILYSLFKINILRIIVLIGTFALALAFASNDLVNFIGVPLAGYESFRIWSSGTLAPDELYMSALDGKVQTPVVFLLISGLIMVLALWFSKKARSVTKTEINLSRQDDGYERFESNMFSRVIVRQGVMLSRFFNYIMPSGVTSWLDSRFDKTKSVKDLRYEGAKFDLLRASVNLVVASALIAIGTSLKLPLSTTYVTFMVAMATALADRSWGRESAVYRISGVVTVITGWFFTAFAAFTGSFLIALFLSKTGFPGLLLILLITVVIVVWSFIAHRRRTVKEKEAEMQEISNIENAGLFLPECGNLLISNFTRIEEFVDKIASGLIREERRTLRMTAREIVQMNLDIKGRKNRVHHFIRKLQEQNLEAGVYYVQIFDYLREAGHSVTYLMEPVIKHIENNHPPLTLTQKKELRGLSLQFREFVNNIIHMLNSSDLNEIARVLSKQAEVLQSIKDLNRQQLKRIKKGEIGTRTALLYLGVLNEAKNLTLHLGNVIKSYRDFSSAMKGEE